MHDSWRPQREQQHTIVLSRPYSMPAVSVASCLPWLLDQHFPPNICWPNVYSLCWGCCYEGKQNILCDETVINPPKMSTSHVFLCFAGRAYPSLRDSHAACIWFICLNMESSKELQGILPQCSLRLAKTILQESWAVTKMNWTLFNWDILKLPRAWGLL